MSDEAQKLPEMPQLLPYMEAPELVAPKLESFLSEALSSRGPFIDLGFATSVNADEIVAIMDRPIGSIPGSLFLNHVADTDLVRTVVKLRREEQWCGSSLTTKELRNRLRKAGVAFI